MNHEGRSLPTHLIVSITPHLNFIIAKPPTVLIHTKNALGKTSLYHLYILASFKKIIFKKQNRLKIATV